MSNMPNDNPKVENTRRFKRLRANYLLRVEPAIESGGDELMSNINDLSASGVRFWSERPLEDDSIVQLSFFVPPLEKMFSCSARILRSLAIAPKEAGQAPIYYVSAGFLDLPARDAMALNDFVEGIAQKGVNSKVIDQRNTVKRANS